MPPLIPRTFDIEQFGNVMIVTLIIDSLGEHNLGSFHDELASLLRTNKPQRVVMDLAKLHQIDDLGMAILQSFHDSVEEYGGTSILCRLAPHISTALSHAGMSEFLDIRTSLRDALKAT